MKIVGRNGQRKLWASADVFGVFCPAKLRERRYFGQSTSFGRRLQLLIAVSVSLWPAVFFFGKVFLKSGQTSEFTNSFFAGSAISLFQLSVFSSWGNCFWATRKTFFVFPLSKTIRRRVSHQFADLLDCRRHFSSAIDQPPLSRTRARNGAARAWNRAARDKTRAGAARRAEDAASPAFSF